MTYYKAIRPNGTDFYTGTVQWVPESGIPANGFVVNHPTSTEWEVGHETHLCASTSPTECIGFEWPCRLLEVEPASQVYEHTGTKVSALSWRVVRELPATQALGPQGEAVAALLDGLRRLDSEALSRLVDIALDTALYAAWDATQIAALDAAEGAARLAARDAAQCAAWDIGQAYLKTTTLFAIEDVAGGLVTWDLLRPDQRYNLTEPIRAASSGLWADVTKHLHLTS